MASTFKALVKQINPFFSIVVPGASLKLKSYQTKTTNDEQIEEELKLFVIRNSQENSVVQESVGVIKIISILSSLIAVLTNEKAIVAIDELDAHIFEYLLSIMLKHVQENIKGQLIFTAHNLTLLERLESKNIIVSSLNNGNVSFQYLKSKSKTTNLRNLYLRSQSVWSEPNIVPLMINESKLSSYFSRLGLDNEK